MCLCKMSACGAVAGPTCALELADDCVELVLAGGQTVRGE